MRRILATFIVIVGSMPLWGQASTSVYLTPSGTATGNCPTGTATAPNFTPAQFNSSSNWGASSGQIGPGTTVLLCGTITTSLNLQGNGASGSPVTLLFDTGAKVLPALCGSGGCLNAANRNWITVNGGVTCGFVNQTNTQCNGQVGHSTVTPSGSQFAIVADNCDNCEFENLEVGPLYTRNGEATTLQPSGDIRGIANLQGAVTGGATFKVHNNQIHDTASGIVFVPSGSNSTGLQVYNNWEYRNNSGLDISNNNNGTLNGASVHDNHIADAANWDFNTGSGDTCAGYHHNSLHAFSYVQTASNVDYFNNLIDGNWGRCPTAQLFLEANSSYLANVRVFNNRFLATYTSTPNPVVLANAIGGGFLRVYNNTIKGDNTWTNSCLSVGSGNGGTIYVENNIIQGCNALVGMDQSSLPLVATWDYNTYAPALSESWYLPSGGVGHWYSFAQWLGMCSGCDTHSLSSASATYVAVNADGSLPTGSVGIHDSVTKFANLTALGISALNVDAVGTARPSSGFTWDAGAYQYSSGTPATPAPSSGMLLAKSLADRERPRPQE